MTHDYSFPTVPNYFPQVLGLGATYYLFGYFDF